MNTSGGEHSEQELRDAAERGDIGKVARLIESGVSVNANHGVSNTCTSTFLLYSAYCHEILYTCTIGHREFSMCITGTAVNMRGRIN